MSVRVNLIYRIPAVCLMLFFCAAIPGALAAEGSVEPPFRYYTVVDGLTQSEVYDIAQDQAGYIWFTTARGLNRYDGIDFDHYTIAHGLPTNTLTALDVDSGNVIWVGDAKGGITLLQGTRVIQTIEQLGDKSTPILDIKVFGERALAIAEGIGILDISSHQSGFRIDVIGDESVGATKILTFDGRAWIVASTGLYELLFNGEPTLEKISDDITLAHADAASTLWVVDKDNRVGIWKKGTFETRAIIKTENAIVDITTDRNGMVWLATKSELFRFDGLSPNIGHIRENVRKFVGVDEVSALFVDRENSVWLASSSRLIRFLGDRFRHYRLRTGTEPQTVWAIAEDKRGRFWFGTQTRLLMREADESLVVIDHKFGIPDGPVRNVVADDLGYLWLSVSKKGLFRFDVDSMTSQQIAGTSGTDILDIGAGADDAVWIATAESGVFRYLPASDLLTSFDVPEKTSVYSLDTWPDGNVWYGADEVGLVQLYPQDDGAYGQRLYNQENGLQHLLFDHIRLTGPEEGWVATEEGGLYRFEDGKFSDFGAETPVVDQTVYLVEPLDNATVVVGGEQGLYQFVPGTRGVAHYNQLVGFIGLETNVHATYRDSDNGLWIGTVDGATRMDTSQPMPKYIEPTPTIISMESDVDRKQIPDGSEVDPDRLGLHVEFAAISLRSPKDIEYSYKLVGTDSSWSPATTNRSVSYPNIPPGDYEFMVRARFTGGEWGREFANRRFAVLPYFWQQPYFVLAAILAVLAAFRTLMIYRTRNIEWSNESLRAQVEERTRSIESAKRKLEQSNRQLSCEIEERQKADQARAEVEMRFRHAFENAPIGMGLLDAGGALFDANPALQNMFWADESELPEIHFADIVCEEDRDRFTADYHKLTTGKFESLDEKLACDDAAGNTVQTVVNLSPVRSESGEFLYSVLQVQDITESLKLTVQLEYQASYDELTGLLNRRAFETELHRAWARGSGGKGPSFLIFMDLDQFKVVNDTSGHVAGDRLLVAVSEILLSCVRANDIVARLGGDEFGIILWECPTEVATRIAESIRAEIENFRFHWESETYRIGVSIGGLPIEAEVGDISELQQLADAACYAAKEAGRNRVHMVAGDKDSARVHRGQVRWVQRIRDAMDNNRFAIYGQVIKPLVAGIDEPERLEILLRLRDPESRKLIPPGAFLPAAERYGLSMELDQWVVKSLLDTLFIHQAFQATPRRYWINLSGSSIGDKRFATFLKDAIRRSPLPEGTINFEITETAVIRSVTEAGNLMTELREMGCQFALDDFGSGLSSFGYLKKLPVDYVKIDGMFIRDILRDEADRIFVKSIIDICRSLNIKTIAEFVENEDMLNLIRDLGADYAQGFGIGRPFVLAPNFPFQTASRAESVELNYRTG